MKMIHLVLKECPKLLFLNVFTISFQSKDLKKKCFLIENTADKTLEHRKKNVMCGTRYD